MKFRSAYQNIKANVVALFTRAWIEINACRTARFSVLVALFTRAWIEILLASRKATRATSRPLHEGVD